MISNLKNEKAIKLKQRYFTAVSNWYYQLSWQKSLNPSSLWNENKLQPLKSKLLTVFV